MGACVQSVEESHRWPADQLTNSRLGKHRQHRTFWARLGIQSPGHLKLSLLVTSSQQSRVNPQSDFIYWKTVTAGWERKPHKLQKFPERPATWNPDRFNHPWYSWSLTGELNLIVPLEKEQSGQAFERENQGPLVPKRVRYFTKRQYRNAKGILQNFKCS